MTYLYQAKIAEHALSNCPPSSYKNNCMSGVYRFSTSSLTVDSFIPEALQNPNRLKGFLLKEEYFSSCLCFALSFYVDEESAKSAFKEVSKRNKIFEKRYTHLACGDLLNTDGVNSGVNSNGHFSHHPYHSQPDYHLKFTVKCKL